MKGIVLAGLRTTVLLALLTAAGCACSERVAQAEPTGAGSPKDKPAAATTPGSAPPATPSAAGSPPPAEAPAETRKPRATAEPSPKKDTRTAALEKPAAEPLDLAALEKRLRETEAIGTLTKLTLKNQVDDLLGRIEAHHDGTDKASLTELRQPFDLLIIKVLSLLQDRDAALAGAIATSREAMWGVLSDPAKFRSYINQNRG
jgi:hypothetical protein